MFTMETLRYDVVFLLFITICILHGSTSNPFFTYLEEDAILSCSNSSKVIHISNISSIRHNMTCSNRSFTVSNESMELFKTVCDKNEQCHIYRTNMSDNDSYLNDLGYYNISCSNQNPQGCFPLLSGNVTSTCTSNNQFNSITFDPVVANCTNLYSSINKSLKNSCEVPNSKPDCMTDISSALVHRTRCFRQFELKVEYSCQDRDQLTDINISHNGVPTNVIIAAMCSLSNRQKQKYDEQRLVDRETSNNISSQANSSSNETNSRTTESEHTYNTIENDNFLFTTNENLAETNSTKDNYFILEKQTDFYEFAEPVVESKDIYALTEYTVIGQDHHGNGDSVPVYAQAADNVYDTSVHKRTGDDKGNLYDHSM